MLSIAFGKTLPCKGLPSPAHVKRELKTGLFVKLTVSFILVASLQVGARSTAQNINLHLKEVPIERVFNEISRQSGYVFFYADGLLKKTKPVTVDVANATIDRVLAICFEQTSLTYSIVQKTVVVKEKDSFAGAKRISEPHASPKNFPVTGKVFAQNNEPLAGATVTEKGTNNVALTNAEGVFVISVSEPSATLVVSYVGYATREIDVNSRGNVSIALTQTNASLSDVVVVGYGTARKKDLTGSVASVGAKDIQGLAVTRVDQALLGKVAGVQVKPVSGEPGVSPQIRIRGIGSISAGAGPLYVVDGFPTSSIETLNPNDIETLDILKDASATAIYGSRGSNGVVIINTRRGKAGKPTITFDTYTGWQSVAKTPKFMNAMEQARYYYDGIRNRNIDEGRDVSGPYTTWFRKVPQEVIDVLEGRNTYDVNALDVVLRTAPQQQYQLSATGGSASIRYALSGEFFNQQGIVINSDFKRYSLRANIDAQISSRLNVKLNINPSFTNARVVQAAGAGTGPNDGAIAQAVIVNNWYPLIDSAGNYFAFSGLAGSSNATNPLALANEVKNRQQGLRVLGNVNAEYKILNELKLNVLLGTNLMSNRGRRFKPQLPAFFNDPAVGTDNSNLLTNWLAEYTLNYNKSFRNHNLSGLLGYTTQKETFESSFVSSNRYPNNLVPYLSAVGGQVTDGSSDEYKWSLVSYLGRVNYNYKSRYYVTASIRTDGSSRFGAQNKYGVFPSFALAWRMSDESFLKNLSFLNELKLRTSYGETGNNNIGNYDQYATISYERYTLGGTAVGAFAPARLANPYLTWEKQKQVNFGLDLSLLNRRISVTVDRFFSKNTDLLLNVNVPDVTGFSTALKNIGEVNNNGWEFVLNTVNLKKAFEWTTDFNLSMYRNKVVKLGPQGDPIYVGGNVTMIGQPIGMFYGFINDGVFKNQAELDRGPIFSPRSSVRSRVGDSRFRDISGPNGKPDGIIDSYDQTIMGSPYPDFYYGMTNRFAYKNLSLGISLQGSQGNKVLSISRLGTLNTRGRVKQLASSNRYWKSEQDPGDGQVPRPNDAPTGNNREPWNSRYLDEGTYLRINNINLGYVLPQAMVNKARLSALRVYITLNNPFLFTKNESFNPDVSNSDNPLTPGIDNNNYPLTKSIVLGLSASF